VFNETSEITDFLIGEDSREPLEVLNGPA